MTIERPIFYEEQILAPADLTADVEHARGQMARHTRYHHLWGIATGLELTGEDKSTTEGKSYKEITLGVGLAVDAWGREIVLEAAETLDPELFIELNVFTGKDDWHPVFLMGAEKDPTSAPLDLGSCDDDSVNRKLESAEVTFGRPGDEVEIEEQPAAGVADGPGDGGWKILLGFVKFDDDLDLFTDVTDSSEGTGRRYVGVRADEIEAQSGKLTIRSRPSDQTGTPLLVMDESDGGKLQFGLQASGGGITPVFTVDSKGNVTAEGTVSGLLTSGTLVESGVAFDGMMIPLPVGITDDEVADGKVVLHIHVSLHTVKRPSGTLGHVTVALPVECRVDGRRVHCRVAEVSFNPAIGNASYFPAPCDYTILAYVPSAEEAT